METDLGRPKSVTFPDGVVWTYYYLDVSFQGTLPPECYLPNPPPYCGIPPPTYYYSRLSSITSTTGYQIKLVYATDIPNPGTIGISRG